MAELEPSDTSGNINAANVAGKARVMLAVVAAINFVGFVGESVVALVIGSASLFADAADFLEDTMINLLVLTAVGWSLSARRKASYALAGLILLPAVAAFVMVGLKLVTGEPPEPLTLSVTAVGALVINVVSAVLLFRVRSGGGALMTGAWLAARNDALANVLIIAAGVVTVFWASVWPDVVVGLVIGVINLYAAKEVFEQARAEVPELEG
ncbi:cation transporter [Brevibacterium sp. UMB1308A]|uniref:cation transporter n=1 Tax=Brevibacterium sp. UMB1308A TaxID=3050608 RepID=UPI0025504A38|nr:cation transporter [Brevibacterium sp. UMB1308A]MDK8345972.1 cation transporter [Brevibacterium sp. UMB1308B]MDK8712928.1 cation transporter [Brevibacterium sp. UMB1308A]